MKILMILGLFLSGCAINPYKNAQCFCRSNNGNISYYEESKGVICSSGANANMTALKEIDFCGEKMKDTANLVKTVILSAWVYYILFFLILSLTIH